MNPRRTLPALYLAAGLMSGVMGLACAADSSSGSARVFKWTDDKGVVHYGDSVPAEFSQKDRSVLNSQGVEVGHVEGAKSGAQAVEADRAASAEQQRVQHDKFLLATYLSTRDIEQLRDERVGLVEAQIKAGMAYIDTLNARLAALQQRMLKFKPYNSEPGARRVPDDLAEELVHTLNESRSQKLALENKHQEEAELQKQFNGDIQRYRELTSRHAGGN